MASDLGDDYEKGLEPQPKQPALSPASPLRPIATSWLKKIEAAKKAKKVFDADAQEAMRFFDGGQKYLFEGGARGQGLMARPIPAPGFQVALNKCFEAVKLLGAAIYNRNPVRTVTPRRFPIVTPEALGIDPEAYAVDPMTGMAMPDPRVQQFVDVSRAIGVQEEKKRLQADLLESYLNFTPLENDLKMHAKLAVDEAIIKGMGVLWTEAIEYPNVPPAEPTLTVGSFVDSVDNLLLDPDAQTLEEITWCAKRVILPIDQAARQFGLTREDLKAHLESYDAKSRTTANDAGGSHNYKKRNGKTNDLVCFWRIYSKCGFGDRLKESKKEDRGLFDPLGDYCYIVVCEGVPFPLNVPPSVMEEELDQDSLPLSLRTRAAWPIPLWADRGGWPFSPLAFHPKPNTLWPLSHIKPGISELRFVAWCMSFLAQRVSISCETIVGVSKAADQDLKEQLLDPSQCGFKVVEVSESLGKSVNDLVSVFQMPGVNKDIWEICQAVLELFEKRCGLTELTYGLTRASLRSATEAQVKADQISIRPDEMAECVENWMTQCARKEAMAARWLLQGKDVASVLGPLGAEAWQMHLSANPESDVSAIAREFDYRIEAGSARKPNAGAKVQQAQEALSILGPMFQQIAAAGNPAPFNKLIEIWAEASHIDPNGLLLPPPAPMPPPAAPGPLPDGAPPAAEATGEEGAGGGPPLVA